MRNGTYLKRTAPPKLLGKAMVRMRPLRLGPTWLWSAGKALSVNIHHESATRPDKPILLLVWVLRETVIDKRFKTLNEAVRFVNPKLESLTFQLSKAAGLLGRPSRGVDS